MTSSVVVQRSGMSSCCFCYRLVGSWLCGFGAKYLLGDDLPSLIGRIDLSKNGPGQADRECFLAAVAHLQATMDSQQKAAVTAFLAMKHDGRDTSELRIIFSHDVVHPMDEVALSAVHRAVYDSFFLGL